MYHCCIETGDKPKTDRPKTDRPKSAPGATDGGAAGEPAKDDNRGGNRGAGRGGKEIRNRGGRGADGAPATYKEREGINHIPYSSHHIFTFTMTRQPPTIFTPS